MRHEKTIPLDEHRVAIARELRLKDVRQLIGQMETLGSMNVNHFFGAKFDELSGIAGQLIDLPAGETIEDLTLSEIELVLDGLKEVNAHFLEKLGLNLAITAAESPAPSNPEKTSIAQQSDSSSADTSTSGTTAGDSI